MAEVERSTSEKMTSSEKELCKLAKEGDYNGVKQFLTVENVLPNCIDEDRMSPLQLAANAGHYDVCKLLLNCGADPNFTRVPSRYCALTFAALASKSDIVSQLLEHGASKVILNSYNKTAVAMAAHFGKKEILKIMNNFVTLSEISEIAFNIGNLRSTLLILIHKMALLTNVHPIRLILFLQNNLGIMEQAPDVWEVFTMLSVKKLLHDRNDLLSLKFHHMAYILKNCHDFVSESSNKYPALPEACRGNTKDALSLLIRYWIKGDRNGFPIVMEKLLRQVTADYPFKENSLYITLIATLEPVSIGQEPSAIWIINQVAKDIRSREIATYCATCGEPAAEKKCSSCKSIYYCNAECQKLHWFTHKPICHDRMEIHQGKEPSPMDLDGASQSNSLD